MFAWLRAGGHILSSGQEIRGDASLATEDAVMAYRHPILAQAPANSPARNAQQDTQLFEGDPVFQHPDLQLEDTLLPALGG